jgi:hypothetical protein
MWVVWVKRSPTKIIIIISDAHDSQKANEKQDSHPNVLQMRPMIHGSGYLWK